MSWIMKFVAAGGIAGFVSRTVTAPIDRLKVLYQAHSKLALNKEGKPVGIYHGMKSIYQDGGIKAFWRGNLTNVLKVVPESSLFFALFESFKFFYSGDRSKVRISPRFRDCVYSATSAGFITTIVMYPMETIKARWMSSLSGTYQSVGDCIRKTLQNDGWTGLYKGLTVQLLGTVPYAGINLTIFEMSKSFYERKTGIRPSGYWCVGFGSVAVFFGQVVAYPPALVRTRLQTQGTPGHPDKYEHGASTCIKQIWKSGGLRGFYRGLLTTYMKIIPAMGITFGVYEIAIMKFGL
jgi:solute carrier family 25 phosphate transporter 23/24/25/41